MKKYELLIIVTILFSYITANAQVEEPLRANYLSAETGLAATNFKVAAFRYAFEYQKDINRNWQYGIAYERMQSMGDTWFLLHHGEQLKSSQSILSVNAYYKLFPKSKRVHLSPGLGVGIIHMNWGETNKVRLAINASLTVNVRVSNRVYLQFSPAFVLGNRAYFSPFKYAGFNYFFSYNVIPFGVKVRL